MLELAMTKKGWGTPGEDRVRSRSRERVSLLGNRNTSNSNGRHPSRIGLRGRVVKDEEKVSLLGPSPGKTKKRDYNKRKKASKQARCTITRMMKYAFLMMFTAGMTYKILRKETKIIKWDEYNNILNPKDSKGSRCIVEEMVPDSNGALGIQTQSPPCACPDPYKPVENTETKGWKSNHDHMVHQAKNAPRDLDIVFFGDGLVEQLSGTRNLGTELMDGMEEYFERTFGNRHGGKFNAIALGSSGDTGPNLLWHWENGIQQANLRPKMWYIIVGSNDLYISKCKDEFVKANILNVAKRIFEDQPDAKIVVHGILPRKDNLDSKSNSVGDLWNRAQGVNLDIRKFIKKHSSRIYYMNLGQTLMEGKGRMQVNPRLINGMHPTSKGMQKWGDLAVKKLVPILKGFNLREHMKQSLKPKAEEKTENSR